MEWTNVVTAMVAVYGAILSSYTFIQQMKKDRPGLKVKVKWGMLTYQNGNVSDPMIFVNALNQGHTSLTLSGQGLELPNKETMVMPIPKGNVRFPHELDPGKSCQIWFEVKEVAELMKSKGYLGYTQVVGFYTDEVDRQFKSKPFKFNIDEFSNS